MRIYCYVGDQEFASPDFTTARYNVRSFFGALASSASVTMAFIVSADGELWIADRQSEHIVCARGEEVLAAGEITFSVENGRVFVAEVTNLSTGYCPEPECWQSVRIALDLAGIAHPGRFTSEYQFRRCTACGMRNVIKDDWYVCGVCGADLLLTWNFADEFKKAQK